MSFHDPAVVSITVSLFAWYQFPALSESVFVHFELEQSPFDSDSLADPYDPISLLNLFLKVLCLTLNFTMESLNFPSMLYIASLVPGVLCLGTNFATDLLTAESPVVQGLLPLLFCGMQ